MLYAMMLPLHATKETLQSKSGNIEPYLPRTVLYQMRTHPLFHHIIHLLASQVPSSKDFQQLYACKTETKISST